MWRKKEAELPAITCYGREHALLANSGEKLRVLNLKTGVVVHEFGELDKGRKCIHCEEDTLAVVSQDRTAVTTYKLSFSPCVPTHTTTQMPFVPDFDDLGPTMAQFHSRPTSVSERVKATKKSLPEAKGIDQFMKKLYFE
ncbi:uncharacterized protein [Watersipora subatra]|uniref:uncharacterized protein n=1 Tax=Watersipora subatra TaxID=2589382 RepID=UPI00355B78D2